MLQVLKISSCIIHQKSNVVISLGENLVTKHDYFNVKPFLDHNTKVCFYVPNECIIIKTIHEVNFTFCRYMKIKILRLLLFKWPFNTSHNIILSPYTLYFNESPKLIWYSSYCILLVPINVHMIMNNFLLLDIVASRRNGVV